MVFNNYYCRLFLALYVFESSDYVEVSDLALDRVFVVFNIVGVIEVLEGLVVQFLLLYH